MNLTTLNSKKTVEAINSPRELDAYESLYISMYNMQETCMNRNPAILGITDLFKTFRNFLPSASDTNIYYCFVNVEGVLFKRQFGNFYSSVFSS